MYITDISIENFRNIKREKVEFENGINVLVGKNGQGKTNLIEAIGLASIARSFRGARDSEMISFGEDSSFINLHYFRKDRIYGIKADLYRDKTHVFGTDYQKFDRVSQLYGRFNTVIFCPEHLSIVKEGPAVRRKYIDIAISQLNYFYINDIKVYRKLLLERNKLIKDEKINGYYDKELYECMSQQMAKLCAAISYCRVCYIDALSKRMAEYFSEMTDGKEAPELHYSGSLGLKEIEYRDIDHAVACYENAYANCHKRELMNGSATVGIHRDDIIITLNSHPAKEYASQGQQRSIALAMKLAEGDLSEGKTWEPPVYLFDDVLSELDSSRREYLMNHIGGKQVIMSGCEFDGLKCARIINVEGGKYV